MIVCICAGVSERKLHAVIADGATTMKAIERCCGAGAGCGACRPLVRECLRQCEADAAAIMSGVINLAPAEAADLVPA